MYGILGAIAGASAGFLIGMQFSYSNLPARMGIDGPAGGVAFVMLILVLAVLSGVGGFMFALLKLRRRQATRV